MISKSRFDVPEGEGVADARGPRGFTLIELLVVISIISLLAGIILPSLGKARALGRSTACKGNLHAAGSAFQMYLNNSNDVMPFAAARAVPNSEGKPLLVDVLGKNLSSPEVLLCPGDTDKKIFLEQGSSYFYSEDLYNFGNPYTDHHRVQHWGAENVDVLSDDVSEFHQGVGGKNWLYLDWHVTD
ncbi:MAG: type II secretion system protein [Phycisphaerae bacterium]|nr:type II secretion system protein [Phycisphaerae bacterium]